MCEYVWACVNMCGHVYVYVCLIMVCIGVFGHGCRCWLRLFRVCFCVVVYVFVFVCVCFACELVCCFFAVGVVKNLVLLVRGVGVFVQGCACVSVFKAVRACR